MYLDFYNLKKEPFQVTPDPEFIYLSESHKEALASIVYGTEQKKGFIAITGAVGVGKTTVLRLYLSSLQDHPDRRVKTVYILNPNVTFHGLVKTIYRELGIRVTTKDTSEMVNRLHRILVKEYKTGNNIVLIIDEAQNMPMETLENLRMLSNLETSTDKLMQIVLVGQPELDDILGRHELRQLKQRIAVRAVISPLTVPESREYIAHRLLRAGSDGKAVFTEGALLGITNYAQGVPRTINIVCDNSLITGFGYQEKPVTARIAKEVIRDLGGGRDFERFGISRAFQASRQMLSRRAAIWTASIALVLLLVFFLWPNLKRVVTNNDHSGKTPRQQLAAESTADHPEYTKRTIDRPPYPFLAANNGEHVMLFEKETKKLYLYCFTDNNILKTSVYSPVHSRIDGEAMDVPKGIYFISDTSQKAVNTKDTIKGVIITSLNRAMLERRERAAHEGAEPPGKSVLGRETGILLVGDKRFLKDLPQAAKRHGTPVAVVDRIQSMNGETQKAMSNELKRDLEAWRKSWERKDADGYFHAYAQEFTGPSGMSFDDFRRHKKRLFNKKGDISVKLERIVFVLQPEYGGNAAVSLFHQRYRSRKYNDLSIKVLYLKKEGQKWKITREGAMASRI